MKLLQSSPLPLGYVAAAGNGSNPDYRFKQHPAAPNRFGRGPPQNDGGYIFPKDI
jgi:hypothetical protein